MLNAATLPQSGSTPARAAATRAAQATANVIAAASAAARARNATVRACMSCGTEPTLARCTMHDASEQRAS